MKTEYDFRQDIMTIDGVKYKLRPYRKYLLQEHNSLVTGHFIKAITAGDITKFTYDWQTIYFLAAEYFFLRDYIEQYGSEARIVD